MDFLLIQVLYLGDTSGNCLDHVVRRIMAMLMTSGLTKIFNVQGRHGQRQFVATHLMDVIQRKGHWSIALLPFKFSSIIQPQPVDFEKIVSHQTFFSRSVHLWCKAMLYQFNVTLFM